MAVTLRTGTPDAAELVTRIQAGEEAASLELYEYLRGRYRWWVYRQVGPENADDRLHNTYTIVVAAILRGELEQPERLYGFVSTVLRRQIATEIDERVQQRAAKPFGYMRDHGIRDNQARPSRYRPENDEMRTSEPSPEEWLLSLDRRRILAEALSRLRPEDREVLQRFYLLDESPGKIQREMGLTLTTYRLRKSRAKQRLCETLRKSSVKQRLSQIGKQPAGLPKAA